MTSEKPLDGVELLDGYASKLRTARKELRQLEKQAERLADKQAKTEQEREGLEAQLKEDQRLVAALKSERESLKGQHSDALFEGDTDEQQRISERRNEIDKQLEEAEERIREAKESLGMLPDHSQNAAELAAELDMLSFGDGWRFSRQMETELVNYELQLKGRRSEAKRALPKYSSKVYEEIRSELDESFAAKQRADETRAKAIDKKLEQNRKLDDAARNPKKAVADDEGFVVAYK